MTARRRLPPAERHAQLLQVGAQMFAELPYEDVRMDDVAARAGVSRALLYRHYASKRDLFAAVFHLAAGELLRASPVDLALPLANQVVAGLEAHIEYFAANRNTVLAANRVLAGDATVQAIISAELGELRRRIVSATGLTGPARDQVSSVLTAWLLFVRVLVVEWLEDQPYPRADLRDICLRALFGALDGLVDLDVVTA